MMNRTLYFLSLMLSSLFGALIALGIYIYFDKDKKYDSIEQRQNMRFSSSSVNYSIKVPEGLNFMSAADIVRPAVVHIKTTYRRSTTRQNNNDPLEEMFKQFHGDGSYKNYPRQSSGSGVIIADDGYIATNNHVIDDAGAIEVILNDKRSYIAKLIGTDPSTDLALLKIDEEDLPFVKYGNSEELRIGEWVLAVGNPFDLTSTVTAGIVSAKGRNINLLRENSYAIESFIQTDAAINPGNSGGALVNLKGELIGVNTAIATQTGYYSGYSFAIPISIVKKVMDDILKYGEAQRALLGVSIVDVDARLAEEKNLKELKGVYIEVIHKGGAALLAGLLEGDVIYSINGVAVNSSADLQTTIANYSPGDKVEIVYLRKGKKMSVIAVLKNKKGNIGILTNSKPEYTLILGSQFIKISNSEKARLGIKYGVKVLKVGQGKIKESGIREGFIITRVDDKPVNSPGDIQKILYKKQKTVAIVGVYMDGSKAYYAIGW